MITKTVNTQNPIIATRLNKGSIVKKDTIRNPKVPVRIRIIDDFTAIMVSVFYKPETNIRAVFNNSNDFISYLNSFFIFYRINQKS